MNENIGKTPEEIEKELSVGNFAKQQATTLGLTFGGAGLGYLAGMGAAAAGAGKLLGKMKSFSGANIESNNKIVKLAAGFIGLVVGSIASNYGHWKKVERERKGVEEINKDVAAVMEKRVQFEDTIDKQSEHIKRLIADHEKSFHGNNRSMGDKILAERTHAENSEQVRGA